MKRSTNGRATSRGKRTVRFYPSGVNLRFLQDNEVRPSRGQTDGSAAVRAGLGWQLRSGGHTAHRPPEIRSTDILPRKGTQKEKKKRSPHTKIRIEEKLILKD